MSALHITLLFAGLCALLQCALTALVVVRRMQTGVDLMDGDDAKLLQRIRAHGNFAETVPMALLLMALLELEGLPPVWLVCSGLALVTGRVLHMLGMLVSSLRWCRLGGMVLTLAVISIEGVLCLWVFLR